MAFVPILTTLIMSVQVPPRWTPQLLPSPDERSPAVGAIGADGAVLGGLRQGSFGPSTMAMWQDETLLWSLEGTPDAFGHVLDASGNAWGVAEAAEGALVLKVSPGGTVMQTWNLPADSSFTSLAGVIGGEAVARASGGSGSSYWTSWICRNDGEVEEMQWNTSMYAAAVGQLPDGERVVVGSFDEGGWWRGFMYSLDNPDATPIDLAKLLQIESGFVHAESIASTGVINLRWRDEQFNWRPMRWSVDGWNVSGPAIPFVSALAVDAETGAVAAAGMLDGVSAIWRWIPDGAEEFLPLDEADIAVMNCTIDDGGVVLCSVLTQEPVYGQQLRCWLPGETYLHDVGEFTVGEFPQGDVLLLDGNGQGDAVLNSTDAGVMVLRALPSADVDGDGTVGIDDLLAIIGVWGPWAGPCGPDLDHDGIVGVDDLLILLGSWSAP
ncbi:MAG: hypothetical protein MK101_11415 [Phycisphaerales bacterium]|nr:hypothetical protein [Phycisphaerales bacterium]